MAMRWVTSMCLLAIVAAVLPACGGCSGGANDPMAGDAAAQGDGGGADAAPACACPLGEACVDLTCQPGDLLIFRAYKSDGAANFQACGYAAGTRYPGTLLADDGLCSAMELGLGMPLAPGAVGSLAIDSATAGHIDVAPPPAGSDPCVNGSAMDLFQAGEAVTLSGAAGELFPAFEVGLTAPAAVELLSAPSTIVPGQPATFSWTGGEGIDPSVLIVAGVISIRCEKVPDTGRFDLAGTMTEWLPAPATATWYLSRVARYRATPEATDLTLELHVTQRVTGSCNVQ